MVYLSRNSPHFSFHIVLVIFRNSREELISKDPHVPHDRSDYTDKIAVI